MDKVYRYKISVIMFLAVLIAFAGCSERVTETSGGSAELRISAAAGGSVDMGLVSLFKLTVTGPGIIDPIQTSLVYDSGMLAGTVLVPAGPDRVFLLEGFDETGKLIYSGRTVADVEPDAMTSLTIRVQPRIPMVRLSPAYYYEPYGTTLAYRLLVNNITDINRFHIRVTNQSELYGTEAGVWADSVILNRDDPTIAEYGSLNWYGLEGPAGLGVYIGHRYSGSSIAAGSGQTELATIYFGTDNLRYYSSPAYLSLLFEAEVIDMISLEGDSLTGEDIYSESYRALLFDYREELIGFWRMDWESENADSVRESSGNNLGGIAFGTAWDEGMWGSARTFDGVNDYISVPDNRLLDLDNGFTLSFNIKVPYDMKKPSGTADQSTGTIISRMSQDGEINYQLLISRMNGAVTPGYCKLIFRYGSSPTQYYSAEFPDIADNYWHNIIFTCEFGDPSSAILMVDYTRITSGEWMEGTGSEETVTSNGPLTFGRQLDETEPYYLYGGLDHVELYGISFGWDALYENFFPR